MSFSKRALKGLQSLLAISMLVSQFLLPLGAAAGNPELRTPSSLNTFINSILKNSVTASEPIMPNAAGGPDGGGYVFLDSVEPGGPAYNFVDISGSGTLASNTDSDDAMSTAIPLGFNFTYYGSSYSEIYASTNGFLTFLAGQDNGCCSGDPMPSTLNPNGVVAGFWTDLSPEAGGDIYYQTLGTAPNRYFILQYEDVCDFEGCGQRTTFQIKLFEGTGVIEVHYAASSFSSGTVDNVSAGIENQAGNTGLQYAFWNAAETIDLTIPSAVRYFLPSADVQIHLSTNFGLPAGAAAAPEALPNTFTAGENMVITAGVYNSGPDAAVNTVVQLTLPVGFHYLDDTDACLLSSSNPDVLDCALGDLATYDFTEFQVTAAIDPGLLRAEADGTAAYTISATLTTDSIDPDLDDNFDELDFFVTESADLRIEKFAAPSNVVEAGEQFTYTILVDNLGPSSARNIVITDTLITSGFVNANGCSLAVRTDGGAIDEFTCNFAISTGVFDLATMGSNWLNPRSPTDQGRIIITINATAEQALDMINTTTVTADTPDPDSSNNMSATTLSVTALADLSVTKTATGEVQVLGQMGDILNIGSPGAFPAAPNYQTDPDMVTAGRRVSYELTVSNDGPSTAENVVLMDSLPAGITIVPGTLSLSQGACNTGAGLLECGLGDIGAGNSVNISFHAMVAFEAEPGSVLVNDAFVYAETAEANNDDNFASTMTIVDTWADMTITKLSVGENVTGYDSAKGRHIYEDLPGQATAGQELRYEITVQNNGPSDAQGVQVLDLLPGQTDTGLDHDPVTFLYADGADCRAMDEQQELGVFGPGGGKFGQVMWCDLGTVPAGARVTFDIYVQVDPAVPDGFTLTNGAFVWWGPSSPPADPANFLPFPFPQIPAELPTTDDPYLDNNFADTDTFINAVADVSVTKTALDSTPVAGEMLIYAIEVTNHGPSIAEDLLLSDLLPMGAEYLMDSLGCWTVGGDPSVDCDLGSLMPGESIALELTVQLTPQAWGLMENQAAVSMSTMDYNTANNTAIAGAYAESVADLNIVMFSSPDAEVMAGEQFTYTMLVDNYGPSSAHNVVITDTLISSGFVDANGCSLSVRTDGGAIDEFNCNFALSTGVFDLATMGSNWLNPRSPTDQGRIIITINANANQAIDLNNYATVTSDSFDPDMSNNSATDLLSVLAAADLSIEKTVNAIELTAGDLATYTLTVHNAGPSIAENVVVVDELPEGVTLTDISWDVPGSCLGTDTVTCYFGNMGAGEMATIVIEVMVHPDLPDGTLLQNTAMVSSDAYDLDTSDNADMVMSGIGAVADLSISKVADPVVAVMGEQIEYTIVVMNHGPSDVFGGMVMDLVPEGLEDVTWECKTYAGMCPTEGAGDIEEYFDLPAGAYLTITLWGTLATNQPLTNEAWVTLPGDVIDPDLGNNYASVTNTPYTMFLPSLFGRTLRVFEPDLVVTSLVVNSSHVEVKIKNVGLAPVTETFWVDVMFNPVEVPWMNNQIWNSLSTEGLVWGIGAHALPLNPGDELTLKLGDEFFWGWGSYVEWPIEPGTLTYVHVDSWHAQNEFGAVQEDHELLEQSYNNIYGPKMSVLSLTESGSLPAMDGNPFGFTTLPER